MKKKLIAGFAAAAAIVAVTATPAFANVTVDGTEWSFYGSFDFGVDQFGQEENGVPHGAYSGDGFKLVLDDPDFPGNDLNFDCAGSTQTTQADGDAILDCDNPSALLGGDLSWDADITVFSGDYRGIVGRMVYTLTNTTNADLTLDLRFDADTEECDSGSGNIATSSGDLTTAVGDAWLSCNNNNRAIETMAWGNNWMTSFAGGDSGCDVCEFKNDNFVLAANSSVNLVFFLYSEGSTNNGATNGDTDANIIANATSYFDVTTLGTSRLWEDLTTAENWDLSSGAPSSEDPTLPNTGVDASGLLLAAAALIGLGAVIVIRRRSAQA